MTKNEFIQVLQLILSDQPQAQQTLVDLFVDAYRQPALEIIDELKRLKETPDFPGVNRVYAPIDRVKVDDMIAWIERAYQMEGSR